MKKIICLFGLFLFCSFTTMAQKYALIDMEYILKNIPEYQAASEQIAEQSQKWQKEVEAVQQEAQEMYKKLQKELTTLTPAVRSQREEAIIKKEQEAQDLKRKYFGADGELMKLQEQYLKPIQDDVYNAVKEIAEQEEYALVIDRASAMSIIFASPRIDISDDVLQKLGYSK